MQNVAHTPYGSYTYNSRNVLKRFSHRSRFKHGESLIEAKDGCRILDVGCGDAMFLNKLLEHTDKKLFLMGYEPYLDSIEGSRIAVVTDWETVLANVDEEGGFDYVLCFEVLEHLSVKRQEEMLREILSVLSDRGKLVVSVPIEKGFPALIKNQFRSSASHPELYGRKNAWSSFIGKDLSHLRQGEAYLSHIGFYFTDLEKLLSRYFTIEKRFFSPFKRLGYHLNSQVFYCLKTKRPAC